MIELLIVISLIGVLSGILLNVIGSTKQKQRAEDAVKRTNLEKAVAGIEAFRSGEGRYPISPLEVTDYIKSWPGAEYIYNTNLPAYTEFWIYVPMSVVYNPPRMFKYCSNPPGSELPKIKECIDNLINRGSCTPC